jgi:hypothetical protein
MNTNKYLLHVLNGPITRSKIKALKEVLNRLVLQVSANAEIRGPLVHQEEALAHLINLQEGSNPILFEKIKSTKIDLKKNHSKNSKKKQKKRKQNIVDYYCNPQYNECWMNNGFPHIL